ncbi:MAG TPA: serpin family protein, partial [Gemmatimonadales bacterium]
MRSARGGLVPAALLITACSQATQEASGIPPLLTELPRALSSGESRLVTAGNQLAFDLLREAQRDQPAGNIFLSPTSAAMALAMTRNGAAGATRDSMERALRLSGIPDADINAGYRSLIDLLRGLDRRAEFAIANSIWTDAGVSFAPAFLEAART